jgi:hypothetical protein
MCQETELRAIGKGNISANLGVTEGTFMESEKGLAFLFGKLHVVFCTRIRTRFAYKRT